VKKNILSFLLPLSALIIVFLFKGVLSGENTIMLSDLEYQYYPILNNFKEIITTQYSFFAGFGSSMIGTFAYYLASPLNLLIYFIKNIDILIIVLILFKISLCGFTMYKYLNYHFGNKYYLLIFSTAYALSLYNVASYFQIMWLDGILLAPLLLLGIDKLINEKKPLLYGITLFFMILTNYYIGYMGCIFSVLYFLYQSILNNKNEIKTFIITSILSGMMSMFLTLPTFMELLSLERSATNFDMFNTDFSLIISRMFICAHNSNTILNLEHPFLYCGIFVFPLLMFYFVNKKISKKEKILSFIFLLIFFLSIIIEPINIIWHAFTKPIGFNYRYVFLFVIFVIYLCCKAFKNIKSIDKKYYLICFIIYTLLALIVLLNNSLELKNIYISVFLCAIYLILFYNIKNKDFRLLFMILAISEIYFNCHVIFLSLNLSHNYYIKGRENEKNEVINYIKDYDKSLFYRVEFDTKRSYVDGLTHKYNNASTWLSSVSSNSKFYKKIGYFYDKNMYAHNSYILLDSLFGIKYYQTQFENKYYNFLRKIDVSYYDGFLYDRTTSEDYVYENPYSLSLGYMVSKKDNFECFNVFDCQNKLFNNMTGLNLNVYSTQKLEIENNKFTFRPNNDNDFYIYYKFGEREISARYSVYLNDKLYKTVFPTMTMFTHNNIFLENNQKEYHVSFDVAGNSYDLNYAVIGYFDFEEFKKGYDSLKNNQLNITKFKNNHIIGNIEVNDNKILFLSIPYQDGFNIYVDGEKVDYYCIYDNFIGLDLTNGYHEIEIIYEVPYLKAGIFISFCSCALFIFYNVKKRTHK